MNRPILSVAVSVVLATSFAGAAAAATRIVNFTLTSDVELAPSVASGQFSYDNSLTGVIGYGDLLAFSLTFTETGNTYDLSFVNSPGVTTYRGFSFDTSSRTFVTTAVGGVPQIMSAIRNSFDSGFFVRDDLGVATDYVDERELAFTGIDITSRVTGAGVPEPATWALMILGFGLAGAGLRRRAAACA